MQPLEIESEVEINVPEAYLDQNEILFQLTGEVLYVGTLDHQISQIVFCGNDHTYIYDTTDIVLRDPDYLQYYENIPIPLQNMKEDDYHIYVMYQDRWCDTGHVFSKI